MNMTNLETAKKALINYENSFVCMKGEEIHTSKKHGIAPILELIKEKKEVLIKATIADKVIGKAAALLLIKADIKEMYAGIISEHALKILLQNHITVEYDTLVPYISNRKNDGMCPMEEAVLQIDSPEEAYLVLINKVAQMQQPIAKVQ